LRARGGLTVWFTAEAIAGWRADARTGRDGQAKYSDLAIATALALRAVFRLALREPEGLIASNLQLLGLDLAMPDHSTLSHRAETLEVPRLHCGREPVHLLVGSTGLGVINLHELKRNFAALAYLAVAPQLLHCAFCQTDDRKLRSLRLALYKLAMLSALCCPPAGAPAYSPP
jgi:alkylhydroperoxidase family enzyme